MSENNNTCTKQGRSIPNHWQIKKLGEVCTFSQGIQVDVTLQSLEKKKDQVRFLRIIDFTQGDDPHRYIDNPGERYYLQKDDIAMVRYGTVGFVCTGKEGIIANNLFKIEPDVKISKKYLIQFLQSDLFRRKLETKGATMQALSFGLIKPIQIPIPPLSEQQLIVSRIEELLSDLENGKQQLLTAQQQMKVYRQSLLKAAFEGRFGYAQRPENSRDHASENSLNHDSSENNLNHDLHENNLNHDLHDLCDDHDFGGDENNQGNHINHKNRSSDNLPKCDALSLPKCDALSLPKGDALSLPKGDALSLPKGWKWVKVGDVCKCIVPNRDKPKSFTGNIKWVTTPNLNSNTIRLDYRNISLGLSDVEVKEYNARVIPVGSVIMTCVGTFGLSAIVEKPIVINQQLHAFIPDESLNPKYLAYCIQYSKNYFEKKSTSTTIQYLNKENCNSMPLPLPPLAEQQFIVSELESKLTVCDKLEETIKDALLKSETLRQSILKKAFNGELIKNHVNP